MPTLALPPLSPERAPKWAPNGVPAGIVAGSASIARGVIGSSDGGPVGAGSMRDRVPSPSTTIWSISSAGTSAGQYTPNDVAGPGGLVVKNPG